MTKRLLIVSAAAASTLVACSNQRKDEVAPAAPAELAREQPGVHNVLLFDDAVISGSMPHGEDGFRSLSEMGVKTIISVDGGRPDLELAEAYDIEYIHIPIRYNGIEEDARLSLARAMREAEGPIFVHCHHGRHRGPAAAAYALVACGRITPEEGVALMKEAGTSSKYPGLYGVVSTAAPVDDATIDEAVFEGHALLVEEARVEGLVAAMAAVGVSFEHMQSVEKAGWMVPEDHPDLAPAAESGILADLFRDLQSADGFSDEPANYIQWMKDAQRASQDMEDALVAGDSAKAAESMKRLGTACDSCHAAYRNE